MSGSDSLGQVVTLSFWLLITQSDHVVQVNNYNAKLSHIAI